MHRRNAGGGATVTRRLLKCAEVQAITGLSRSAAYELMHALGCLRVLGRSTRVWSDKIEAYMRASHAELASGVVVAELEQSPNSLPGTEPPTTAGVYAIQGAGDFIKIGRANNIRARVRQLRNQNPMPIKFLAVLSANPEDEAANHMRWAHLRQHGEWFAPGHDLLDHLDQLRGATP